MYLEMFTSKFYWKMSHKILTEFKEKLKTYSKISNRKIIKFLFFT